MHEKQRMKPVTTFPCSIYQLGVGWFDLGGFKVRVVDFGSRSCCLL